VARGTFVAAKGGVRPAAAPRFSAASDERAEAKPGGTMLLVEFGFSDAEIADLRASGALIA